MGKAPAVIPDAPRRSSAAEVAVRVADALRQDAPPSPSVAGLEGRALVMVRLRVGLGANQAGERVALNRSLALALLFMEVADPVSQAAAAQTLSARALAGFDFEPMPPLASMTSAEIDELETTLHGLSRSVEGADALKQIASEKRRREIERALPDLA